MRRVPPLDRACDGLPGGSGSACLVWPVTELVQMALRAAARGHQSTLPALAEARHPHVQLLRALPDRWRLLAAETERLLFADESKE